MRRIAESLKGGANAVVVSFDGEGAQKKFRKISGRCPTKPSKLNLCRFEHHSSILPELVVVAIGVTGEGQIGNGDTSVEGIHAYPRAQLYGP